MIINNTYFVGQLYIPHAKPSVTSDVTSVDTDLNYFINKYERDCLIKCLGFSLYKELVSNLDTTKPTLIKDGSDAKWNELVNGKDYTVDGESFQWRGLRFKNIETDSKPSRSFLANYVYWFYEQEIDITRAGIGTVKLKGKNAEQTSPAPKVVRAWNEMVEMIQGKRTKPEIIEKYFGLGLDYYSDNREVDLYKFIEDMNDVVTDTYQYFKPYYWKESLNEFGI